MHLTGLHVVLTYQCVFECGHCFIWGSPKRGAIFHLDRLDNVLDQAAALGTIGEICYEGGETFVYYPILIAAVRHAAARHLRTTVVTNGYWANSVEQARIWLGRLADAGLECVRFVIDGSQGAGREGSTHPGIVAAEQLGLVTSVLRTGRPHREGETRPGEAGRPLLFCRQVQAQPEERVPRLPWTTFTGCPYVNLADPGHVHVDPSGDVHLCRGLVLGNLDECSLAELVAGYSPARHPVIGPLLAGGPAELVAHYGLAPEDAYGDACDLCHTAWAMLLQKFPAMSAAFATNHVWEPG